MNENSEYKKLKNMTEKEKSFYIYLGKIHLVRM